MVITEHEYLYCGTTDNLLNRTLSEKHFGMLESFILSNTNNDTYQIMKLSQKANRKIIKVQEYVGLIQLKDGFQIEILPKIHTNNNDISTTKRIFLEMLQSVFKLNLKKFSIANVGVVKNTIFEVFIETFISEVENILKFGLYSNYEEISANENFLSGKLLISKNLCENYIHKEKFFIQYDVFSENCSENRLIKSTLLLLKDISNGINRSSIVKLLNHFHSIKPSRNYSMDFSNCTRNRNNYLYENALNFAKVFLSHRGFSTFSGNTVSYALLFSMNDIFEKYVANLIKKSYLQYDVTIQDTSKYLFEGFTKRFNLRPDIVIRENSKVKYILDTKWKLLSKHDVDIQDMYQMYTYSKRFNCTEVILLYPKTEGISIEETSYHTDDGTSISIEFIDLNEVVLEKKPIILKAKGTS